MSADNNLVNQHVVKVNLDFGLGQSHQVEGRLLVKVEWYINKNNKPKPEAGIDQMLSNR